MLIRGRKINGGRIMVDSSMSSQFLSALLLVAPLMTEGLVIDVNEDVVSWPYVSMTLKTLKAAGIMAKCCECGAFNPAQAEMLLEKVRKGEKFARG